MSKVSTYLRTMKVAQDERAAVMTDTELLAAAVAELDQRTIKLEKDYQLLNERATKLLEDLDRE